MVGETKPISVATQVKECWEVVPSEEATLVVESDKTVAADRSRFRQLLENLLANAVEHGDTDTDTDTTVSVGGMADGFYVADDGAGIPTEQREKIFDAAYSTATAEDETGTGTGFGLRIVKEVVETHGWEIQIVDSHNGGHGLISPA